MKRKYRGTQSPGHFVEPMEARRLLSVTLPPGIVPEPIAIRYFGSAGPIANGTVNPQGYSPAQIRGAYNVGAVNFGGASGDGTGITIAVVDAYDDVNALSDLRAFDAAFGLPDPPTFQKLNDVGQASPLPGPPPAGSNWGAEISLDIEWIHTMAPKANLLLFEGNDPTDLYTTETAAASTSSVSVISNSWGNDEFTGETSFDSVFTTPTGHTPITFVFSAGDNGAFSPNDPTTITPDYPASSPNVVAVGGTNLHLNGNTYSSETAWGNGSNSGVSGGGGGGGGGISQFETQPSYQSATVSAISTTQRHLPRCRNGCRSLHRRLRLRQHRLRPTAPWGVVGGTSLSSPLFAGLIAIANQGRTIAGLQTLESRSQTLPLLYGMNNSTPPVYHDITSGNNGYPAGPGYDLTTGMGSPIADRLISGLVGLVGSAIGDRVFNDANANGIQDDGNGGVGGVTVDLFSTGADSVIGGGDDTLIATTTTDSAGHYQFTGVQAGNDYVHFHLAPGFRFSPPLQGSNRSLDSDPDPTTGNTAAFNVLANSFNESIDAGMFQSNVHIDDIIHAEGNTGFTAYIFTVTISPVSSTTVNVPFTTVNGTATTADNDFVANSGTLSFAPGVISHTITVNVVGDTHIELDETFSVQLTNPAGFGSGKLIGVGTIINDDIPSAIVSSVTMIRPTPAPTSSSPSPSPSPLSPPLPCRFPTPPSTTPPSPASTTREPPAPSTSPPAPSPRSSTSPSSAGSIRSSIKTSSSTSAPPPPPPSALPAKASAPSSPMCPPAFASTTLK